MSRTVDLLRVLAASAYAPLAVHDGVEIDVVAGSWAARIRSPGGRIAVVESPAATVSPAPSPSPADGRITCSPDDLDRMLRRLSPEGGVTLTAGSRDIAPRRRQAHLVLVAAALSWDGPWPAPTETTVANPHRPLVAEALCDLAIGARDRGYVAANLPIRATDTAAGTTLLLDAGTHALRLDVPAREPVTEGIRTLARLGRHVHEHGAPQGDAWIGPVRWTFEPDPAFPRGWTMPEGVGGVWLLRRS